MWHAGNDEGCLAAGVLASGYECEASAYCSGVCSEEVVDASWLEDSKRDDTSTWREDAT